MTEHRFRLGLRAKRVAGDLLVAFFLVGLLLLAERRSFGWREGLAALVVLFLLARATRFIVGGLCPLRLDGERLGRGLRQVNLSKATLRLFAEQGRDGLRVDEVGVREPDGGDAVAFDPSLAGFDELLGELLRRVPPERVELVTQASANVQGELRERLLASLARPAPTRPP